MGETTAEAREEVAAARAALSHEVDELGSAARSALDIPDKVKRHPVQTVGLGAAVALLAAGAPRRGLQFVRRRLRGGKAAAPPHIIPKEVERALDDLGPDGRAIHARLEREFARWLENERKDGKIERSPSETLFRLAEAFVIPFGAQASRRLTERLFAADPNRPAVPPEGERATGAEALVEDAATVAAVDKEE